MHAYVNTAITAARKAGRIIIQAFDRLDEVEVNTKKSKHDYVTTADIASEEAIIEILQQAYPKHRFLGEETGNIGPEDSPHEWVIDPLDGTANFVHGYPYFCISIALRYKGKVEHAVIYDPIKDDIYCASLGGGAQKNNHRLRLNKHKLLDKALIGTALPSTKSHLRSTFIEANKTVIENCSSLRICGAAALDLAYVAAGSLDGFWSVGLKPWDVAAASLIIKEAGGIVMDHQGGESYIDSGNIIAANPKLIKQLVSSLKPYLVEFA